MKVKPVFVSLCCLMVFSALLLGQKGEQEVANTFESLSKRFEAALRPVEEFEALSKTDGKNPLVWHFLGVSQDAMGNESAARKALATARDLDPRQAWHAQSLAEHYFGVGDFEQSQRFYRLAISLETRPQVVASLKSALTRAEDRRDLDVKLKDEEKSAILHTWILGILGAGLLAAFAILAPRLTK